ncbi:MAG: hypothetical protein ACQKBW_04570, partial [Puniceicoccales bacterium]
HPFNRHIDSQFSSCTLSLDWEQFSPVVMSDTLLRPLLNRVIHAHYESMLLALNHLVERGYRRIGYCMDEQNDLVTNRRWQAAYCVYMSNTSTERVAKIPMLIAPSIQPECLASWLKENRIEAFVSAMPNIKSILQAIGFRLGDGVAYADLDLDIDSDNHAGISGINQNSLHFGHASVDLVINGILKNEHGIPRNPLTLQIEGTWCDRGSTPVRSK